MIQGMRHIRLVVMAMAGLIAAAALPPAQAQVRPGDTSPQTSRLLRFDITIGKSEVVDLKEPFTKVSVTNPAIADVFVMTPSQILVNGKAPGVTNLVVFYPDKTLYFDLVVQTDIVLLQERLRRIVPREEIAVQAAGDSIILTGQVGSEELIGQAGRVAEIFAPKKVVNLLKVAEARPQQVLLQVQVAEAARLALKELGFSFFANGSSFQGGAWPGATFLPGITPFGSSANMLSPEFLFSDMSTFFLATGTRDFFAIVRMLEEKDLLRTLAKPNLVTLSGKEARFLSGGEFPYPVPQGSSIGGSTVTIEFKPFGVQLGFTPVVREDQTISMRINPEVSSLDFSQGLRIEGFTVPVIRANKAATSIELKDGESFAIAGLINNEVRQQVAKIPFLGDIPILGALFRSTKFVNNETELLFLVTVKLVKPFPAGSGPDPRKLLELREDERGKNGFTIIPGFPGVGEEVGPFGESALGGTQPAKKP